MEHVTVAGKLLSVFVPAAMALVGCATSSERGVPLVDSGPGPADTVAIPATDLVTASLLVPQDFTGVPSFLRVSFYQSIPPVGMPVAFGDRIANPALVPGQEFPLSTTQAGLTGPYYMTVVIYCQGGGNGLDPVAGVDWVGMSEVPLSFGPGTGKLDAGQIVVIRY
jgi:hypothetical protein